VLTYALLEALHRPEGAAAEPVSVFGLAAHVMRQVPAISQSLFGIRQTPRFTPRQGLPARVRAPVLKEELVISTIPTPRQQSCCGCSRRRAGRAACRAAAAVHHVNTDQGRAGWAYIHRDGNGLGYVPEAAARRSR
jgi:hypothetical protein